MKFIFRDAGFSNQSLLNATWTEASVMILWSSIVGRLGIGYFADIFSKEARDDHNLLHRRGSRFCCWFRLRLRGISRFTCSQLFSDLRWVRITC